MATLDSRISKLEKTTGVGGWDPELVKLYEQFVADTGAVPIEQLAPGVSPVDAINQFLAAVSGKSRALPYEQIQR
ncbi:MAG: hypothetical protein HY661_19320 [Betaproteobacteria bacterium]|nr:hypothetical protein [Betaproteobacteria bacterium]